jgi:hypothetical protein
VADTDGRSKPREKNNNGTETIRREKKRTGEKFRVTWRTAPLINSFIQNIFAEINFNPPPQNYRE